jgi:hypothetical protein
MSYRLEHGIIKKGYKMLKSVFKGYKTKIIR